MNFDRSFWRLYREELQVPKEAIIEALTKPTHTELLSIGAMLTLKTFAADRFTHLLVGTTQADGNLFFAYWLPQPAPIEEMNLEAMLLDFLKAYGCKLKIKDQYGYIIKGNIATGVGEPEDLLQVITVDESDVIRYDLYPLFDSVETNDNKDIILSFAIAINNYTYQTWLQSIKTVSVRVHPAWHSYLTRVAKALEPTGKTKLDIYKRATFSSPNSTVQPDKIATEEAKSNSVEIPAFYQPPFEYISTLLETAEKDNAPIIVPTLSFKKCIFCESDLMSQEHIFPKWMRAHFSDKDLDIHHTYTEKDKDFFSALQTNSSMKRQERLFGLTINDGVCIDCNTNWMSKLEHSVQAILTKGDKFLGSVSSLGLDDKKSTILAHWLCIKAVLLGNKFSVPTPLTKSEIVNLQSGILPSHFVAEVVNFESNEFQFRFSSGVEEKSHLQLKTISEVKGQEMAKDFFKLTFQVGHLLFRASFFHEGELRREAFIIEPTVLFPASYSLLFTPSELVTQAWNMTTTDSRFLVFHNKSLRLTEA